MFYYLLAGLIIGCIVTGYEYATGSSGKRTRALVEIFVVSILGTFFFSYNLPISLLSAFAMATIFAVVNQTPQWYFGTEHGNEICEFIGVVPPVIIFVIMFTGFAWYGAAYAAIPWLIPGALSDGVLPQALAKAAFDLAGLYSVVTWVTVIYGFVMDDIVYRLSPPFS